MESKRGSWSDLWRLEDWWAVWIATILFGLCAIGLFDAVPRLGRWTSNPLEAIPAGIWPGLGLLAVGLLLLTALAIAVMRLNWQKYLLGFLAVFVIAILSFWIAGQKALHAWGMEYAIWALAIGLLVANTVGTPGWLLQGAKSELFIKIGLVLLGGEILFSEILALGAPGLMVAWIVTPTVIVFMFLFGVRGLKMKSKTMVIIIAAATSVCGVSAAIATAAACRAKKEELTLVVGMTMIFTVGMMIAMPAVATLLGLSPAIGGAWIGGTVDSTGAVVAAGAMMGPEAEKVAAVVKMIQNVLIGLVAFVVAVYWVARVDATPDAPRPGLMEVWRRFPKFIVGFVLASVVFSFLLMPLLGEARVSEILDLSKGLRTWFFCFAFAAIGLESNFKALIGQLVGGKPIILYVVGQSFNLALTLFVAWIAFGLLFGGA